MLLICFFMKKWQMTSIRAVTGSWSLDWYWHKASNPHTTDITLGKYLIFIAHVVTRIQSCPPACQCRSPRQAPLTEGWLVKCGQLRPIWEKPDMLLPCHPMRVVGACDTDTLISFNKPAGPDSSTIEQIEILMLWCYQRTPKNWCQEKVR